MLGTVAPTFWSAAIKIQYGTVNQSKLVLRIIPEWVDEANDSSIQAAGQQILIELSGIKQDPHKSLVLFGCSTKSFTLFLLVTQNGILNSLLTTNLSIHIPRLRFVPSVCPPTVGFPPSTFLSPPP
jgi:hypothetical protein